MILLLDTSTPTTYMAFVDDNRTSEYHWQADRELAKGLLGWIETNLSEANVTFGDIEGIGIYKGPGSFTGLRIGMTVSNTLADSLGIPIVTAAGPEWKNSLVERLRNNENDGVALPLYDREANITKPRK